MTNKNYGWLWYFAIVLALSILATIIVVRFNLSQQLKPETLEKAEALWKEKGPKDYLLAYTISTQSKAGPGETHYVVKVKDGHAFEAKVNGLKQDSDRMSFYGMPSLFGYIDKFLDLDEKPGAPKTYVRGIFDPKTGALERYIRSVMSTGDRVEINVAPLKNLE
jgi:hypothetical protein